MSQGCQRAMELFSGIPGSFLLNFYPSSLEETGKLLKCFVQPFTLQYFGKQIVQPCKHCEICQKDWCGLVQGGNVWKSMVQLLGIVQEVWHSPAYGEICDKNFCTTLKLVKFVYFDPSLPS